MRRISAFFINLMVLAAGSPLSGQDTLMIPMKIRAGIDLVGPGIYIDNRNNLTVEGFISYDRNEKMSYVIEGGYLNYKYSQYNYDYLATGIFFRAGTDFNLLKPAISNGKSWAGIGLRYGLSIYNSEYPHFQTENYWGTVTSSNPGKTSLGHILEVAPGVRTELFRNFSIGWTIRLNLLLSGGTGKDIKSVYIPGFGNGGKNVSAGINYYLVWSIPYKIRQVITKKEAPPEEEEEPTQMQPQNQPSEGLRP